MIDINNENKIVNNVLVALAELSSPENGNGCIIPSPETIADGSYTPLSRPLFIYINVASLERPEVMAFVNYYMEVGAKLTDEVGYVAADSSIYEANLAAIK